MFERGFWDTVPTLPTLYWPALASAILFTMFRYNRLLQQRGILHDDIYRGRFAGNLMPLWYAAAGIFDAVLFIYSLYIIGWTYLFAVPVIVALMFVFVPTLGVIPYGHYLLPAAYTAISVSYLVLLGIINVPFLVGVNATIYAFLKP
jgi:hypothetical protein